MFLIVLLSTSSEFLDCNPSKEVKFPASAAEKPNLCSRLVKVSSNWPEILTWNPNCSERAVKDFKSLVEVINKSPLANAASDISDLKERACPLDKPNPLAISVTCWLTSNRESTNIVSIPPFTKLSKFPTNNSIVFPNLSLAPKAFVKLLVKEEADFGIPSNISFILFNSPNLIPNASSYTPPSTPWDVSIDEIRPDTLLCNLVILGTGLFISLAKRSPKLNVLLASFLTLFFIVLSNLSVEPSKTSVIDSRDASEAAFKSIIKSKSSFVLSSI